MSLNYKINKLGLLQGIYLYLNRFGIGLIDSNFDLWRSTYNEKHKYGYPFNYLPVLKSALQKCVRRGLAD